MSLKVQSFFLRAGLGADSFLPRPAGYLAAPTWTQQRALGQGTYARYMGPLPGRGPQVAVTNLWGTVPDPSAAALAFCQFCSDPLQAQVVAAGAWTVAFGAQLLNAAPNYSWEGAAALHVINGLTGERRATVFNLLSVGAIRFDVDERTVFAQLAGAAFEVFAGDYLCLELGLLVINNGGGAQVPQATIFCDGTTPISADNVATASAQAALYAPVPFTLSVPQPGEQPDASVSFEESVVLTRGMWPRASFHDFEDPASPDKQLLDFLAQGLKTFGYDVLDLLERELDPSRAVLKLQDWRELYSMPQNPRDPEELRALVIARLREYGAEPNIFNVAAAVGVVLGYADPTQLQVLEISAAALRAACEYVETIPGGVAIPVALGFDPPATPLTRLAPWCYDGGAVWGSGARLELGFNLPAGTTIRARLTGPDGTRKEWAPLTQWDPRSTVVLYAPEFAGKSVHGRWRLDLYRTAAPAASLLSWRLLAPGAPRAYVGPKVDPPTTYPQPRSVPNVVRQAGLAQWKFWWGVFADPAKLSAKTAADFGAARQALSRFRLAPAKADLILSKSPIPDASTSLPDSCVPS